MSDKRTLNEVADAFGLNEGYVTLKDMNTAKNSFPKGTKLKIKEWKYMTGIWFVKFDAGDGKILMTRVKNAHKTIKGFAKPPGIKTLEKYMDTGKAKTPTGKTTDPDGTATDGSPSWLLVLGMI